MGNVPFDESALRITPSPPPSQGSASSAVESKYLRRVRILHYGRIGLSVLFLGLGTAVLACESHALRSYNVTHLESQWWLPLWPQEFDLRSTKTLIIGSAIVTFFSLIYIVVALIPSPRSRTTFLNLHFTIQISTSFLTSLVTLLYTLHIRHVDSAASRYSIQTWTCLWSTTTVNATEVATSAGASASSASIFGENGGIPDPPLGFRRICQETRAAWGMMIALACVVGALGGGIVIWGWWVAFRVWRERRREEKLGTGYTGFNNGYVYRAEEWIMQNKRNGEHGVAVEVGH